MRVSERLLVQRVGDDIVIRDDHFDAEVVIRRPEVDRVRAALAYLGGIADFDLAVRVADDCADEWVDDGQLRGTPRDDLRWAWAVHRGKVDPSLDERRDTDHDVEVNE